MEPANSNRDSTREAINLKPVTYDRADTPTEMLEAAKKYESRFKVRFDSLTYFSEDILSRLHNPETDITSVPNNVMIASHSDPSILNDMEILSNVANSSSITTQQRESYFAALKNIYGKLPSRPDEATQDESKLFVGIEREGRILAQSLGWLPGSHNVHPDAKRVPFHSGLLIGLGQFATLREYDTYFIIDGAIASGATIISVIEKLHHGISSFNIYSVHSTYQGLHAITRYGRSEGLDLRITVGHATAGISKQFYAIDATNKLIVGDLGDTISDLVG
jgi:hypothetical protein